MIEIKDFNPRLYQTKILETAKGKNTLVILPTGLGKTHISLLLSIHRLNQFPNSKIILVAPTKPLCNQHYQNFIKHMSLDKENIVLVTGLISPKKREEIYQEAKIIIATPQTIQSDIKNKRINLENISALTIDECHRSRQHFANTIISQHYVKKSNFPRILALTASPGSTKKKINEIKENLFIEAIEIRDEESKDVLPYIQKKVVQHIEVELPPKFKQIHKLVSTIYKEKLQKLKGLGLTKPLSIINKRDLISFQTYMFLEAKHGNRAAYYTISLTAQAIKLSHSMELLETQGLIPFCKFLKKMESETTKAAKAIKNSKEIIKAKKSAEELILKNIKHPKINKLKEIAKSELEKNSNSKIIVFANFRDTVKNITTELKEISKASPVILIGQKEGITQKKQLETLKDFEQEKYNIIVTTSIGEEGLDIKGGLSIAIFFDAVPSTIRLVQRSGRVGRLEAGKIIHLITKNTRDQGYFWKSLKEKKKMKNIIKGMQNKLEKQTTLKT